MMILILAASLACFFMGASFFVVHATQSQTQHANPNYYYLTDPQILAADDNNVYVVNARQLLAFNAIGDLKTPNPYPLEFDPVFIRQAGNFVFLFEKDGFTAFTFNTSTRTFAPWRAVNPKILYNRGIDFDFFDASLVNSTTYRVFFASATERKYGWNDYSTSLSVSATPALNNFTESSPITAFAYGGTNTLFICANDIFQVSTATTPHTMYPANTPQLSTIKKLAVVPNTNYLAYINPREGITLFDRTSGTPCYKEGLYDDQTFPTGKSRDPLNIAATKKYVYVIDEEKHSIDRYEIMSDSTLIFDTVIAGHIGGDRNFFNNPSSLTLINSSLRGNAETISEYLVTDEAGQVVYNSIDAQGKTVQKPFFTDTSIRLSYEVRATFDNYNQVYIYDRDSNRRIDRVRSFTMNGDFIKEYTGFGRVTRLFADTCRTVYVLDQTRNGIYKVDTPQTPARTLPAGYTITTKTNAVYCEKLSSIILSDGTTKAYILPIDGSASQTLNFTNPVIDVAIDALGNLVIMSEVGTKYFADVYEDNDFTTAPTVHDEIEDATVNLNTPSLNLDRINNRLLYIGTRNAVKSFELTQKWSPSSHSIDWKNTSTALKSSDTKFLNATDAGAVIYKYPGGTLALAFAPKGSVMKVLDISNYYVLYENSSTGEHITGYVSQKAVSTNNPPYSEPEYTSARVIFNDTIIFKYPTSDESLILRTLPKNFEQSINQSVGLILSKKVTSLDKYGFQFYEIRLRAEGASFIPDDRNGTFVGYIYVKNVINYNLAPSTPKFLPNATIQIPASRNKSSILVYECTNEGEFIPHQYNETLANKQKVQILERRGQYTKIQYEDGLVEITREGWVESTYVVSNGLSVIQLIAFAVLILIIIGGATWLVIYIKNRRLIS